MIYYLVFTFRGRIVRVVEHESEKQMNGWLAIWLKTLIGQPAATLDSGDIYDDVQAHKETI